jgi:Arabinose efflux permease
MLYVVLPTQWQQLGLSSLWEVGVLLSVNRIVRLPLNPLVGWLYGKMNSRSGIIFAGILATGTTLSYGVAKGFALWLALRCIWGVAWTFLRLGGYFTILKVAGEDNRGHYMGLYNGLYRLGSLGGMLVGGILADRCGIAVTAAVFGAVTFFAIPVAYRLLPGSPHREAAEAKPLAGLANAAVLWTLATGLVIAMVYQGTFTATLSYLIQIHTATPLLIFGTAVGAASLSGMLQALRWGWEPGLAPRIGRLSDGKCGRLIILTAALVCAAALFALIPAPLPLELWLLVIVAILLTATVLTTVIDAIACDVAVFAPPQTFMTAYSFAIDLGAALGPLLGYTLNAFCGPDTVYWIIAALLTVLAAKWIVRPPNISA